MFSSPQSDVVELCRQYLSGQSLSPGQIHFLSGAIAGGVSKSCTAPIDRIKVIIQSSPRHSPVNPRYTFWKILSHEGLTGFFRGNGINCIKAVPECAIKLSAYDYFKRRLIQSNRNYCQSGEPPMALAQQLETEDAYHLTLPERLLAASCAGIVAQTFVHPLDVVKTRLSASFPRVYDGFYDCLRKSLRLQGWRFFTRGYFTSVLGIAPYAALDMTCFESCKLHCRKRYYPKDRFADLPASAILVCGTISSSIGQTAAYPLNLLRTRLQTIGMYGSRSRHIGGYRLVLGLIRAEGVRGLYRGCLVNLMKTVPSVSISWTVYELSKRWLS